jgi:CheY-like chemotaxis protein
MARLLATEGFGVVTAGTAADAKAVLALEPVDLLICDVELPDGDGCELLAAAHEARPNGGGDDDSGDRRKPPIRGIAVSGHTDKAQEQRCRSMGFDEYLCKPVAWGDLIAAVRRLV